MEKSIPGTARKGTIGQKERFRDNRHDPYKERKKWPEGTRCPTCGALFTGGRWTWQGAGRIAQEVECPACQRIAKNDPAGIITLGGPFFDEKRDEVMRLVHNIEQAEKGEHPLERLVAVSDQADGVEVTTTGVHLARRIGDAIKSAYQGELAIDYGADDHFVRIGWRR